MKLWALTPQLFHLPAVQLALVFPFLLILQNALWINLSEFGETRRGWLGVQIQTVTDEIAESLGLDRAYGALVSGVVKEGPAEASGIFPVI